MPVEGSRAGGETVTGRQLGLSGYHRTPAARRVSESGQYQRLNESGAAVWTPRLRPAVCPVACRTEGARPVASEIIENLEAAVTLFEEIAQRLEQ